MPKAKSNAENNPTVIPKFIKVGNDYVPQPGTGYDILTEEVLTSGSLTVLNNFSKAHEDELNLPENAPAKRYLEARIDTAEEIRAIRSKQQQKAALGIPYEKPELDNQDGFIGLSGIKYPDYQTSAFGCWSISYSMLLKSRGVNLSQEQIRQWRPDYHEGIPENEKANPERKRLMNSDDENSIYANADLAVQLLPNTAVNMLRLEPFSGELLSIDGQVLSVPQLQTVAAEYKAAVKKKLQDTITEALISERSPLSIAWDGHYVTVTGISEDGNTIRYEDSRGWEVNAPRTKTITLDELVRQGMERHYHNNILKEPTGFEMAWLSDMPQAEYGQAEKPAPDPSHKDFVKMNDDGSLSVSVPMNARGYAMAGNPSEGQLDGKSLEQSLEVDQEELKKKTGLPKVEGWGANGGIYLGSRSTYYPKKTVLLGDPKLSEKAKKRALKDTGSYLNSLSSNHLYGENQEKANEFLVALSSMEKAEKDPGKYAEAQKKLAGLYDFLLSDPDGSGKPLFESASKDLSDASREKLVNGLTLLNKAFKLGKDEEVKQLLGIHRKLVQDYREEQRKAGVAAVEFRAAAAFRRNVFEAWEKVLDNQEGALVYIPENAGDDDFELAKNASIRQEYRDNLAFVAASYSLLKQMQEKGIKPLYPSSDEVRAMVPRIRDTEAFEMTVTGVKPWLSLPKGKNPGEITEKDYRISDFLQELADNEKMLREEKADVVRYTIEGDRLKKVQKRICAMVGRLDETKTGSYTGLGVISRIKNSDEFEQAKAAMRKIGTDQAPTGAEMKTACGIVMKYLEGKEKVRTRGFGKTRFDECMSFLAEVMPRDQFEAYCAEINKKRGVDRLSDDYIGPENYYPQGTTVRRILRDAKERILRGGETLRDYARALAVIKYADDGAGEILLNENCDTKSDKRYLRLMTDKILADPRFKTFIESMPKEDLQNIVKNEKFDDLETEWSWHKNAVALEADEDKKSPEITSNLS